MTILGIFFGVAILLFWVFFGIGILAHDPNKPTMTTTIEIKRGIIEGEEEDKP